MECKKCRRDFNAQRKKNSCPDCSDLFCSECFLQSGNFFISQRRVCSSCFNVHSQLYGAQRKLKGHDAFKKKNWRSALALYEGVEDKFQDPILAIRIGIMLQTGMGGKKDPEKASTLFSIALPLLQNKPDNVEYLYYIGVMYDNGFGVAQSTSQAFTYYKLASDQGDSNAQYNIGYMYQMGTDEIDQDWANSFRYYKLSANRENPDAQFKLGYYYANGYGVDRDDNKAFKFYSLSAQQGDPGALCNLGYMHQYGYGCDVDYSKSMLYYKKAAEKKLSSAHSHIGYLHEMGLGVPKNLDEAFKNYKIASDLGVRSGHSFLGQYYETLEDYINAKYYYGLAASMNDNFSIEKLKYLNGSNDNDNNNNNNNYNNNNNFQNS